MRDAIIIGAVIGALAPLAQAQQQDPPWEDPTPMPSPEELEDALQDPMPPNPPIFGRGGYNPSPCAPCGFPNHGWETSQNKNDCEAIVNAAAIICDACEDAHGGHCQYWCDAHKRIGLESCEIIHPVAGTTLELCQAERRNEFMSCMAGAERERALRNEWPGANYSLSDIKGECVSRYAWGLMFCNELPSMIQNGGNGCMSTTDGQSSCDYEEVDWCCWDHYYSCEDWAEEKLGDCSFCCGSCPTVTQGGDGNVYQCATNCWNEYNLNIRQACCGHAASPPECN